MKGSSVPPSAHKGPTNRLLACFTSFVKKCCFGTYAVGEDVLHALVCGLVEANEVEVVQVQAQQRQQHDQAVAAKEPSVGLGNNRDG